MNVDCHCHILPGLDDGAQTLEDSIFLAGKLVEWGYERAVCTSHCSYLYRNTPSTVRYACGLLQEECDKLGIPLELVPSMEYRLIPDVWPTVRSNGWLLPWEGNHILIELPVRDQVQAGGLNPVAEARWLVSEGYQPVLAHPERYLYLNSEEYYALKDAGVQFQRNIGALEGMYGSEVKARAETLLTKGMYDWTGTDLHNKQYAEFLDKIMFHL